MKTEFAPRRLDVAAFARTCGMISGETALSDFPRLAVETEGPAPDASVRWEARGEERPGASGAPSAWLHLSADAVIPLVCQRCLAAVDTELSFDRWFRFVTDEETAALEDETADEDVLVASRDFDLHELLEDELLMEIPVTPLHEVCPQPPRLSAADEDFDAATEAKPNAFAVLGKLRPRKP